MDIKIDKLNYIIQIFKLKNKDFFIRALRHFDFSEINDVNNVINGQNIYQLNSKKNAK